MGNLRLILCICILIAFFNNANAYTYEEYKANRPSASSKLTNQFSDYMENVKATLQKNWTAPDIIETGHTRLLIKLDKEGYVLSAKILESSGNTLYDESAIHALQKSEPFGHFPQDSYRESLTINYSFDTSLVKTDAMREYLNSSNRDFYNGDNQSALKNINLAIQEVQGDDRAFFLYKKRAKIRQALGDNKGAQDDLAKYNEIKTKIDIKRTHFVKHLAEVENTPFAYFYLAYCYNQIGDYENAIKAIDKSISMTTLNNQYKKYREEIINAHNK